MNHSVLIRTSVAASLAMLLTASLGSAPVHAASAAELEAKATEALKTLYASNEAARSIGQKSKAILIFPRIVKAGLVVGGQAGEGVMRKGGKTVGYYNSIAASYGLQAGVQAFGYAMFLMTDAAVAHLSATAGWEIGIGPTVVVVDAGVAKSLTTTTLKDDVYAFAFDQKGLMAGLGLQGSKITKIDKE